MNFEKSFLLESPSVAVPWGITEAGFRELLSAAGVKQLTLGHLVATCRLLGGIETAVHFHFKPAGQGKFYRVELHRKPIRKTRRGSQEWQAVLVNLFGEGASKRDINPTAKLDGVTPTEWRFGKLSIIHDYYYSQGLEEKIVFEHAGF
jgi:hypothetical protein